VTRIGIGSEKLHIYSQTKQDNYNESLHLA